MVERAWRTLVGLALLLAAAPIVLILPELGVPMVIVGLQVLAPVYGWAARALAWVSARWERAQAWFERQPYLVKAGTVLGLGLIGVAILVIVIGAL